jgi:hypothetical protein
MSTNLAAATKLPLTNFNALSIRWMSAELARQNRFLITMPLKNRTIQASIATRSFLRRQNVRDEFRRRTS